MDKTSGKDMDRPEFQACLRTLQAGDMLHVHSIDRLTRSLQDLLTILEDMANRNVTVKFYKENLIFRGCPACFLILKGVVISSHETNRFS